ncbi:MAG: 16S rRNA (uracil(1498)-N(3))-methyltransferase [Flavobacteriales bacterium]|nr:16S rRNA (uracil(1498)-N(3))-methyltransferase [Flavobacteriales bacterium]
MHLFYSPHIQFPDTELSEEEAHHGIRVLRLKEGQTVWITDGKGKIFAGRFLPYTQRHARIALDETPVKEISLPVKITMAVAPLKSNDRFEWFLEKATELGVSEIVPLLCEHSERVKCNTERWQRVILAAVKQSLNPWMPQLHAPVSFEQFVIENRKKTFFAHCAEGDKAELAGVLGQDSEFCICIGPEGDFSASEIKKAGEAGYIPVSLGDLRLRTETAALTALIIGRYFSKGL